MLIKPFGLTGGGGLGCVVGCWNGSKNLPDGGWKSGGAAGGPNGSRGDWSPNDRGRGGDGEDDKLEWSLFNYHYYGKIHSWWSWGFFISLLTMSFFPTYSSFNKEPRTGFSASNIEMSSKTTSSGFCLLIIFLLIGSSFCLKLTLLIQPFVT